jgi:N-acetylglutamate synthase-like GNAT family acetyltransferase
MVTIAQCQRLQSAWFAALATATGGRTFSTYGCTWAWLPARAQLMLLFPEEVSPAGIRPALAEGSRLGARTVGVWLNGAVRSTALSAMGFDPGWQPSWMAAPIDGPAAYEDGAAQLTTEVPEYLGPLARELRVVRSQPRQAWHAETRVGGNVVGAAYGFYPSGVTGLKGLGGIFSLEVLPEYRHRGLGTALVSRAAKAAAASGARNLAVNAAPSGSEFFASRGFDLVGRGKTLWMTL